MTWIEEDILGINLTPNRYNALVPAIVYVSNDESSQSHSTQWRHNNNTNNVTASAREWDWNLRIGARTYLHFFMCKG